MATGFATGFIGYLVFWRYASVATWRHGDQAPEAPRSMRQLTTTSDIGRWRDVPLRIDSVLLSYDGLPHV